MLSVLWSEEAIKDLSRIAEYIDQFDYAASERLQRRIEDATIVLASHPFLHREGRVPGTRELFPHPNYMVVYQVRADHVLILSVLHVRRQYP